MQAPGRPAPGQAQALHLYVGEALAGERVAWTTAHAAAFRLISSAGERDILPLVPTRGLQGELRLRIPAGSQLLAYDSHPSEVTLEADRFHGYLIQEGLHGIARQRERAGTAQQPGRERFRRSAKLMLRGDGATGAAYLRPSGQRIEIVPLADPLTPAGEEPLAFEVRYEGSPLAGVLARAFHRGVDGVQLVEAVADADGRIKLILPRAGFWLVNAVHMVAAPPGTSVDWDSFWASLAFERPAP